MFLLGKRTKVRHIDSPLRGKKLSAEERAAIWARRVPDEIVLGYLEILFVIIGQYAEKYPRFEDDLISLGVVGLVEESRKAESEGELIMRLHSKLASYISKEAHRKKLLKEYSYLKGRGVHGEMDKEILEKIFEKDLDLLEKLLQGYSLQEISKIRGVSYKELQIHLRRIKKCAI